MKDQKSNRLYVLISNKLPSIYGAVQGGHAVAQWMLEHHNDLKWKNETVIYLSCNIEQMLYKLNGDDISIFREPDLGNEITALAVLGNHYNEPVLKKLRLLQ
jgi:hypothetical protein